MLIIYPNHGTAPPSFSDCAVFLALSALQFAFVFGLPWLDIGLWPQTEGPASFIHGCAAVLSLLVGLQLALGKNAYLAALRSPPVVAVFIFALASAALAAFSPEPTRSLHGTLKHGVGVLWHLELAVAMTAAVALNATPLGTALRWVTGAAVAAVLVLYAFPTSIGVPLAFPEWTGMAALAAAAVLMSLTKGVVVASEEIAAVKWVTHTRYHRGRRLAAAGAVALVAAGLFVSGNRSVALALAAVGVWKAMEHVRPLSALVRVPSLRAASVVTATLALAAAIYSAGPVIEKRAVSAVQPGDFPTVASADPVDRAALQEGTLGTVWSRSYMVRILVDDMIDDPASLLSGNGFGHFATAYEHHAREVPGRRFPEYQPTASTTYWDVHSSANFHSHNMLAEMAAATGIGGAILWLSILAALAWTSPSGAAVALGLTVLGSFWFPLNHMMGVLAVLFTTVARPGRSGTGNTLLSGAGSLLAVLGLAGFGYAAAASAVLGYTEYAERGFPPLQVDRNIETCGFIRTRAFPENEIAIDLYRILQRRISDAEKPADELFAVSTNVISISCMLRRYYETEGDIRALSASLAARSALVSRGSVSFGALQTDIVKWGDDLALMLSLAPSRTEFLPPYVAILATRAPERAIAEIDRFLPRLSESDPVKHYLLARRHADDRGQYRVHMTKALELGFANLWPVSRSEVQRLKEAK